MDDRRTYRTILKLIGSGLLMVLLAVVAAGLSPAFADGPARDESSAKYAVYECIIPADEGSQRKLAAEFGDAPYDRNKLACTADIWNAIASARLTDQGVQTQALQAHTTYINEINTLWDLDFYGIRAPEWEARIKHAKGQADAIAARLVKFNSTPDSQAALALYSVGWTLKYADTKTSLAANKAAMKQLAEATANAHQLFDGNALYVLAKLYYETPEFSGGDTTKGIEAIDKAYQNNTTNPTVIRYYAFVQAQEGHTDKEKSALLKLAVLDSKGGGLQALSDELLTSRDLAIRLKQTDVSSRLTARRNSILAANKDLQRREHTAANLHGGVDPLTGKDY